MIAFDQYAVQAFELQALDYLLKPLQRDRLVNTVERLEQRRGLQRELTQTGELLMICFPTLQAEFKGKKPELIKWRTSKGQEPFTYLLHYRGQLVRKGMLMDLLWPDFELKKAMTHLYTTIYQIRKSIKHAGLENQVQILSAEDGYQLNATRLKLESDQWEESIRSIEGVAAKDDLSGYRQIVDRYGGDYYGEYDYLWAESERQRLRLIWLQHAQSLVEGYALCAM